MQESKSVGEEENFKKITAMLRGRLSGANECLRLQGVDGTWNYDPYMHGMFNGMELIVALMEGRAPKFRDPPIQWLADKKIIVPTHPIARPCK